MAEHPEEESLPEFGDEGQGNPSSESDSTSPFPLGQRFPAMPNGYLSLDIIRCDELVSLFCCEEVGNGKRVGVKIANSADEKAAKIVIRREARLLKVITHPNVVRLIESGETADGREYLVREYIEGVPLVELWKAPRTLDGIATLTSRVLLFQKICGLVYALHSSGIANRSLFLSSIVIDTHGLPHIIDCGVSSTIFNKFLDRLSDTDLPVDSKAFGGFPQKGRPTGYPTFLQSDIFALGAILYQFLTDGEFDSWQQWLTLRGVPLEEVEGAPNRLSPATTAKLLDLLKQVERSRPRTRTKMLEAIVARALDRDVNTRYQTALELSNDLDLFLFGSRGMAAITFKKMLPRFIKRSMGSPLPREPNIPELLKLVGRPGNVVEGSDGLQAIKSLYDHLNVRPLLPDWAVLSLHQKRDVSSFLLNAVRSVTPQNSGPVQVIFDAESIAAIQNMSSLLEELLSVIRGNAIGPPPSDKSRHGGNDDEEYRRIWRQLSPLKKSILRFIWNAGDNDLTYTTIAENLVISRLPGDDRKDGVSDKTVANHCKPMEKPPLSLINRPGGRSSIQLTERGNSVVSLHVRRPFG